MGKVGLKIAIVEFRNKAYWGLTYVDSSVWHFQEINGLGHFRATKDRGFWDNYEYDHEAVFGVEIEDKDRELYKVLHNAPINTPTRPRTRCKGCGTLYTEKELEMLELRGHNRVCDRCGGEIALEY